MLWQLITSLFVFSCAHAQTVWQCNNFPSGNPLSGCSWSYSHIHWGENNIASVSDPAGGGQNVLRIFYPEGSYTNAPEKGGCQFEARAFSGLTQATLTYDVYFSNNYDFVLGGKLPGLYGGQSGTGWCSGGGDDEGCFSARFHWRTNGDGEVYGYIPHEKDDWFCSLPQVTCNFNFGHSFGRGSFRFQRGQWQTISQFIRLNDPGQSNGIIRIFYQGSQAFEIQGLRFRESSPSISIDMLYFSTFFGGSTSDWASNADVYTYFRNFRVEGN